jgi:hypothetical protein
VGEAVDETTNRDESELDEYGLRLPFYTHKIRGLLAENTNPCREQA